MPLWVIAFAFYLGVFGSAIGYLLWNHALRVLQAGIVGTYLYVRPLFTAALAAALVGERLTAATVGGGLLIVAGASLSLRG